jgi:hypothetical protein
MFVLLLQLWSSQRGRWSNTFLQNVGTYETINRHISKAVIYIFRVALLEFHKIYEERDTVYTCSFLAAIDDDNKLMQFET